MTEPRSQPSYIDAWAKRVEAAEQRVAELEGWRRQDAQRMADQEQRLQRATELLGRWLHGDWVQTLPAMQEETAAFLAALAGEDDGPPQPQREGDYL